MQERIENNFMYFQCFFNMNQMSVIQLKNLRPHMCNEAFYLFIMLKGKHIWDSFSLRWSIAGQIHPNQGTPPLSRTATHPLSVPTYSCSTRLWSFLICWTAAYAHAHKHPSTYALPTLLNDLSSSGFISGKAGLLFHRWPRLSAESDRL